MSVLLHPPGVRRDRRRRMEDNRNDIRIYLDKKLSIWFLHGGQAIVYLIYHFSEG